MSERRKLNTAFVRLREPVGLNLFDRFPPLSLLFHLAWMRQVRILKQARLYDGNVDSLGLVDFNAADWDVVVILLEPRTFGLASQFAKTCKSQAAGTCVVGVGQAKRFVEATGATCCDVLVHGAGYSYLEKLSQGVRDVGLVAGDKWGVELALPEEAFAYERSATVGSWGSLDRSNWHDRAQDFPHFMFRRKRDLADEILRFASATQVKHFHFADTGFAGHPDWDDLIVGMGDKPWGITLDGRRRRGIVRRLERAFAQGLRLVKMELGSLDCYVLSQCGRTHRLEDVKQFWRYTSDLRSAGLVMVAEMFYGLPQQTEGSAKQDDEACERSRVIPVWRRARLDVGSYLWMHRKRLGIEVDRDGLILSTRQMTAWEIRRLEVELGAMNAKRLDAFERKC